MCLEWLSVWGSKGMSERAITPKTGGFTPAFVWNQKTGNLKREMHNYNNEVEMWVIDKMRSVWDKFDKFGRRTHTHRLDSMRRTSRTVSVCACVNTQHSSNGSSSSIRRKSISFSIRINSRHSNWARDKHCFVDSDRCNASGYENQWNQINLLRFGIVYACAHRPAVPLPVEPFNCVRFVKCAALSILLGCNAINQACAVMLWVCAEIGGEQHIERFANIEILCDRSFDRVHQRRN